MAIVHASISVEFDMRGQNAGLLFLIPIIALLFFGISVALDRLETVDPTITGAIKLIPSPITPSP
jgi:hypothetical protein